MSEVSEKKLDNLIELVSYIITYIIVMLLMTWVVFLVYHDILMSKISGLPSFSYWETFAVIFVIKFLLSTNTTNKGK